MEKFCRTATNLRQPIINKQVPSYEAYFSYTCEEQSHYSFISQVKFKTGQVLKTLAPIFLCSNNVLVGTQRVLNLSQLHNQNLPFVGLHSTFFEVKKLYYKLQYRRVPISILPRKNLSSGPMTVAAVSSHCIFQSCRRIWK